MPFVQGVNDAEQDMRAAAAFTSMVPGVCQVNVLPFHRLGRHKFARVGEKSPDTFFQAPSDEAVRRAVGIFQAAGLAARAGG
jgi:pyruvate formate lyase activating enzyme